MAAAHLHTASSGCRLRVFSGAQTNAGKGGLCADQFLRLWRGQCHADFAEVAVNRIFVHGHGAVSPAGWGIGPLRDALAKGTPLPGRPLSRPGWEKPVAIRQVPPPESRPGFLAHPRLRRASPISHYVVAAAIEAIGGDAPLMVGGNLRLGVVLCAMSGCVNYSRRFYDET